MTVKTDQLVALCVHSHARARVCVYMCVCPRSINLLIVPDKFSKLPRQQTKCMSFLTLSSSVVLGFQMSK